MKEIKVALNVPENKTKYFKIDFQGFFFTGIFFAHKKKHQDKGGNKLVFAHFIPRKIRRFIISRQQILY